MTDRSPREDTEPRAWKAGRPARLEAPLLVRLIPILAGLAGLTVVVLLGGGWALGVLVAGFVANLGGWPFNAWLIRRKARQQAARTPQP